MRWRSAVAILSLSVFLPYMSVAGDVRYERDRMKGIVDIVSSSIQKNYYDPALKGIDWKQKSLEAKARIDRSENVGQMTTAIFAMVDTLQDSHTVFLPPQQTVKVKFGFEALAVGNKVLVTKITKGGAAERVGLKLGDEILNINGYDAQPGNFDM